MKTLFTIKIQSVVDIITNSSSELFVFESKEKEVVEMIIKSIYPNYLDEYMSLLKSDELTVDQLDTYVTYNTTWKGNRDDCNVLPGFTFDELYEIDNEAPEWRVTREGTQYKLRLNSRYDFVTEENREWVLDKVDPERKMYFLFSIYENPDWEYQEKLEELGTRLHLG